MFWIPKDFVGIYGVVKVPLKQIDKCKNWPDVKRVVRVCCYNLLKPILLEIWREGMFKNHDPDRRRRIREARIARLRKCKVHYQHPKTNWFISKEQHEKLRKEHPEWYADGEEGERKGMGERNAARKKK